MADAAIQPVIVFGICKPAGVDDTSVAHELQRVLAAFSYKARVIKLSDLIPTSPAVSTSKHPKLAKQMQAGNDYCQDHQDPAALLDLAFQRILDARREDLQSGGAPNAWIITSLKRTAEVVKLRRVYGSHFILLGVTAPDASRRQYLLDRLRGEHPEKRLYWHEKWATRIMARDASDTEKEFGQQMRRTFAASEFIVNLSPGSSPAADVTRFVELLFGRPYLTPSMDEQGMFFAHAAGFRSADLGRQVGVALIDQDGEVISTGANEVPKPLGGQYWPRDQPDFRDFMSGYDGNSQLRYAMVVDLMARLQRRQCLSADLMKRSPIELAETTLAPGGALFDSEISDLLEFGRMAHAEMAAISTAARRGVSVRGATLYTTTYPCHMCTTLILASGIGRVVYVHPYPKSRVRQMYPHQTSEDSVSTDGRVVPFVAFSGVAPPIFHRVFAFENQYRRHRPDGRISSWAPDRPLTKSICPNCPCTFREDEFKALTLTATHPAKNS